jgi:hypothetical protein
MEAIAELLEQQFERCKESALEARRSLVFAVQGRQQLEAATRHSQVLEALQGVNQAIDIYGSLALRLGCHLRGALMTGLPDSLREVMVLRRARHELGAEPTLHSAWNQRAAEKLSRHDIGARHDQLVDRPWMARIYTVSGFRLHQSSSVRPGVIQNLCMLTWRLSRLSS